MKLEEIQESWSSDSKIDDTELDNESLKIPELHHKYFRIFSLGFDQSPLTLTTLNLEKAF